MTRTPGVRPLGTPKHRERKNMFQVSMEKNQYQAVVFLVYQHKALLKRKSYTGFKKIYDTNINVIILFSTVELVS